MTSNNTEKIAVGVHTISLFFFSFVYRYVFYANAPYAFPENLNVHLFPGEENLVISHFTYVEADKKKINRQKSRKQLFSRKVNLPGYKYYFMRVKIMNEIMYIQILRNEKSWKNRITLLLVQHLCSTLLAARMALQQLYSYAMYLFPRKSEIKINP